MVTIVQDLKNFIDEQEDEINRHGFCDLIFKIQDFKAIFFDKKIKIKREKKKE